MALASLGILALVAVWAVVSRPKVLSVPSVPSTAQVPAVAGEGTPPDLSTMTPRERFDRLYNRVMRAAEQGDSGTVGRFAPMAFLAYEQLDSVDADARYHAAVLRLHVQGDSAAALRLADSILMSNPRHLFGFLIRGTAGRLSHDDRLLARANADFLAAWDGEMKSPRPEYQDHRAMLDQYRTMALGAEPKRSVP